MKKHMPSIATFIVIVVMFLIAIFTSSCSSKSGQRKQEKVIIMDVDTYMDMPYRNGNGNYHYKINRFQVGVVDYTYAYNLYDIGDTIFVTF